MQLIPTIAVLATAGMGFSLMVAAFMLVARRGGWQQAMQPDTDGHWPLPRKLMASGAGLGCLFAALMFVPGMVPWWDYSWGHGVVFGFFLGIVVSLVAVQLGRQRPQNQGPRA
jgi:hypothetical protein